MDENAASNRTRSGVRRRRFAIARLLLVAVWALACVALPSALASADHAPNLLAETPNGENSIGPAGTDNVSLEVTKVARADPDGIRLPGDAVIFDITITNPTTDSIIVLPVEDKYDPAFLTYVSATPTPTSINQTLGILQWANLTDFLVGNVLGPYESTTIVVSFTAVAPGTTTNTVNINNAVALSGTTVNPATAFATVTIDGLDFGDLPNTYPTTLAKNGARHVILPGMSWLGTVPPDAESDGQPAVNADGDDNTPLTGPDDEDGVIRLPGLGGASNGGGWTNGDVVSGNGGAVSVTINGATKSYLGAFFDFANTGTALTPVTLKDAAGNSVAQYLTPGTYTFYFDIPVGTFDGMTSRPIFARFRLSTDYSVLVSPTGLAPDGEVEDYRWNFGPNAISLRSLTAGAALPAALPVGGALVGFAALITLGWFGRRRR